MARRDPLEKGAHRRSNRSRYRSVHRIATRQGAIVSHRREDVGLQQVCEFLDIPLDPGMMQWFAENVSVERAHVGRWRSQFDDETTEKIEELYASIVADLRKQGVRIPLET